MGICSPQGDKHPRHDTLLARGSKSVGSDMRIGFIGTGNIGNPMAHQLLKAGFDLCVHDLRREAAGNLVTAGARWAESARATAETSDTVITSLPGPTQVETVVAGGDGVLAGLPRGGTWIDMSTGDYHLLQRLAADARERGLSVLEGTVSCGVDRAYEGRLSIFVGGEREAYEKHLPVFEAMAETVIHVGPLGHATIAKLVTNILAFVHQVAFSEGMMLGAKAGVDPTALWRAIVASYGGSFVAENDGPQLLQGDFSPSFSLELACKDMRLTSELARELDVPIEVGGLVEQIYLRAKARYGPEASCSAVMRLIEEVTGRELRAANFQEG